MSALPSQQASQDSHSHQHNPPSSHHPRLFHSTKINSFIRTFNSIFPAEEEDAWRLLLKAASFSAQVAIYLLDDEQEEETSMHNSSLEQCCEYILNVDDGGAKPRSASQTTVRQKTLIPVTPGPSRFLKRLHWWVTEALQHTGTSPIPHWSMTPGQQDNTNHGTTPGAHRPTAGIS